MWAIAHTAQKILCLHTDLPQVFHIFIGKMSLKCTADAEGGCVKELQQKIRSPSALCDVGFPVDNNASAVASILSSWSHIGVAACGERWLFRFPFQQVNSNVDA